MFCCVEHVKSFITSGPGSALFYNIAQTGTTQHFIDFLCFRFLGAMAAVYFMHFPDI